MSVLDAGYGHEVIREDFRRRGCRFDVPAGKDVRGQCDAIFVDEADLGIGPEVVDRCRYEVLGAIGADDERVVDPAAGPLVAEQCGDVAGVIVVQMGQKNVAHLAVIEAGVEKPAKRAVTAVDDVDPAVDDDGVRALPALRPEVRPALCAQQDETRALRKSRSLLGPRADGRQAKPACHA